MDQVPKQVPTEKSENLYLRAFFLMIPIVYSTLIVWFHQVIFMYNKTLLPYCHYSGPV
jgi:hypothetical protein